MRKLLHALLPDGLEVVLGRTLHREVELGLDDDAMGIAGISPEVSPADRRSVADLAASLRGAEVTPTP